MFFFFFFFPGGVKSLFFFKIFFYSRIRPTVTGKILFLNMYIWWSRYHLLKRPLFSPQYCSIIFFINQVTLHRWVTFWTLFCFINQSIFISISHYLNYNSLMINLNTCLFSPATLFLLSNINCSSYPVAFSYTF